ncbi:MAG TPA: hypothetical protein VFZ04_06265 [Longimicrobiales bacterium]
MPFTSRGATLAVAILIFAAASAPAQQSPPPAACTAPEHKQFDFWAGDWNVFNPQGQQIGTNRISRVSGGCALLEEWQAANGPGGKSINFYDAADGRWHQVWVGGDGTVLRIAGSLQEGAMQLMGDDRKTPRGTVRDRITWTPQADGAVEQRWELSTDGGTTWTIGFVGYYRRK